MMSEEIKKVLVDALVGNKSNKDGYEFDIEEYNSFILNLLKSDLGDNGQKSDGNDTIYTERNKKQKTNFINSLLDDDFITELHRIKLLKQFRYVKYRPIFSTENIDFFGVCKNSPSHMRECTILDEKGINTFINIYCQLYGLDTNTNHEIAERLYDEVCKIVKGD
ncbi:hypothetical protein ECANGB1_1481 [Enterospora canceri]|uniref:Uncharacterized protein n=1 Tax=Enterospora canceri TaxID=1081671 RepID=A0A1Y1S5Z5_9MICR|nr:hypothetical protein ECANGB1_1481 [Enterospora canceri]